MCVRVRMHVCVVCVDLCWPRKNSRARFKPFIWAHKPRWQ